MGRNPFRTRPGGLSGPQPTHTSLGKAPGSIWATKRAKRGQAVRREGVFPDSDGEGARKLFSSSEEDSDSDRDETRARPKKRTTYSRSTKSTTEKQVRVYAAEARQSSLTVGARRSSSPALGSLSAHQANKHNLDEAKLEAEGVSSHESDTPGPDSDDPDRPVLSRKKQKRVKARMASAAAKVGRGTTSVESRQAATWGRQEEHDQVDEQERIRRARLAALERRFGGGDGGTTSGAAGPSTREALVLSSSDDDDDSHPAQHQTSRRAPIASTSNPATPALPVGELRNTSQQRYMTLTALRTTAKKKRKSATAATEGAGRRPKKGETFGGWGRTLGDDEDEEGRTRAVEQGLEEHVRKRREDRERRSAVAGGTGGGSKAEGKGKGTGKERETGSRGLFLSDSDEDNYKEGADQADGEIEEEEEEEEDVAARLGAKKPPTRRRTTTAKPAQAGPSSASSYYAHLHLPRFVDPRADLARRKRLASLSSPPTSDFSPSSSSDNDEAEVDTSVGEKEEKELKRMKRVEREMREKKRRFREERRAGYSNKRRY
ncbi:hypothetical protein JCM10908_005617 [Rhodotorula pacifica]|uniref:uncharacterized protein n=1 Tax=Rhodotorula pacifica TaxID=1495444 RepID=UPI00316D54ED